MPSLPKLDDYNGTVESLRQATRAIGQVRSQGHEKMPNFLEWAAKITPKGLSTGHLENERELQLDFKTKNLSFSVSSEEVFSVELAGSNQQQLLNDIYAQLNQNGVTYKPEDKENSSSPFVLNDQVIHNYLEVQNRVHKAFEVFRSQLPGYKTPVVVWPHGFDVSFIWFKNGNDESKDSHMIFGFSPGLSEDEPYLYSYAWPEPAGFVGSDTLPGTYWEKSWPTPGLKAPYSTFSELDDPEEFIQELFQNLYDQVKGKL